MQAAVVRIEDNVVVGIIIADAATDVPYVGTFLVDVDNLPCRVGWTYDPRIGDFVDPSPPPPPLVEGVE